MGFGLAQFFISIQKRIEIDRVKKREKEWVMGGQKGWGYFLTVLRRRVEAAAREEPDSHRLTAVLQKAGHFEHGRPPEHTTARARQNHLHSYTKPGGDCRVKRDIVCTFILSKCLKASLLILSMSY